MAAGDAVALHRWTRSCGSLLCRGLLCFAAEDDAPGPARFPEGSASLRHSPKGHAQQLNFYESGPAPDIEVTKDGSSSHTGTTFVDGPVWKETRQAPPCRTPDSTWRHGFRKIAIFLHLRRPSQDAVLEGPALAPGAALPAAAVGVPASDRRYPSCPTPMARATAPAEVETLAVPKAATVGAKPGWRRWIKELRSARAGKQARPRTTSLDNQIEALTASTLGFDTCSSLLESLANSEVTMLIDAARALQVDVSVDGMEGTGDGSAGRGSKQRSFSI